MNEPSIEIKIPAYIWETVVQKFPWAKEEPQSGIIFLCGVALGVWMQRERDEK